MGTHLFIIVRLLVASDRNQLGIFRLKKRIY